MSKVVITGGSGFIGSHLAARLAVDHEVVTVDIVAPTRLPAGVRFEALDVLDGERLAEFVARFQPDRVIHLAALSDTGECARNPSKSIGDNVRLTANVLAATRPLGFGCSTILAGSAAEYGDWSGRPGRPTEDSDLAAMDPYALSKTAQSALAKVHSRRQSIVTLRLSNTYGAGQIGRIIPTFVERVFSGQKIRLAGMGKPIRQFIHVDDACQAFERAMRHTLGTFNVAPENEELTVRDVAETVMKAAGLGLSPLDRYLDLVPEGGGNGRVVMSSHLARWYLGWRHTIPFAEGIKSTVEALAAELVP